MSIEAGELEDSAEVQRRTGGRSERIRAQVHAAMRQLLVAGRPEDITVAAVAERSGVHYSTIYRRWGDLGTLQSEVALEVAAEQMPLVDSGLLETDLLFHAHQAISFVRSAVGRLLVVGLISGTPERRRSYWEQRFGTLRSMFDRAIERGELSPDAPVLEALVNLTGALYFRVIFSGEDIDEDMVAQSLVGVALNTVGLNTGSTAR